MAGPKETTTRGTPLPNGICGPAPFLLLIFLAVFITGCASAFVGNSPEELKHRQEMEAE